MTVHDCVFEEVEIFEDDGYNHLEKGMKVLIPCKTCGERPLDHMGMLDLHIQDAANALVAANPTMLLYHWAPATRRKQIIRYGLRPRMRPTTSLNGGAVTASFPVICLTDSPSWAWALSGSMSWTVDGEWDLWQTSIDRLTSPVILPSEDRRSGINEVRTTERIYKRDLWFVGTRSK